ncbi:hypothetical protein JCM11672_00240 [Alkaliphilus crotonatoxidans]
MEYKNKNTSIQGLKALDFDVFFISIGIEKKKELGENKNKYMNTYSYKND